MLANRIVHRGKIVRHLRQVWRSPVCANSMSASAVEIRLQFRAPLLVIFNVPQVLPFGSKGFGKRIYETKGNKLRELWFITMR